VVFEPGELCKPRPVGVTVVMVTSVPERKLTRAPAPPLAEKMPWPTCWMRIWPAPKFMVAPSLTRIAVLLPVPVTESPPFKVRVVPGATTKGG